MTVSKEQAVDPTNREFHWEGDKDSRGNCRVWRRNGKTQTWKTRPEEFAVPVKYGLYQYWYVNHLNADYFHLATECPNNKVEGEGE